MEEKEKGKAMKPCPCCGGEGILRLWGSDDTACCYCVKCGAKTSLYSSVKEAMDAWNKRER